MVVSAGGQDQLLVSASFKVFEEAPEDVVRTLELAGLKSRAKGSDRFSTPAHVIRVDDPIERDKHFTSTVEGLFQILTEGAANVGADLDSSGVHLYVSLSNSSGVASFMLGPEVWAPWAQVNATLRVDVI